MKTLGKGIYTYLAVELPKYIMLLVFSLFMAMPVQTIWNWQVEADLVKLAFNKIEQTDAYGYYDSYYNTQPDTTRTPEQIEDEIAEENELKQAYKETLKIDFFKAWCIALLLVWLINVMERIPLPFTRKN